MSSLIDFNTAVQAGESTTVEFVASPSMPRFVQTICAFANAEGGIIYLGVSDTPDEPGNQPVERSITGVDPATVQRIIRNLQAHFDDPLPTVREEQLAHRGPQGPVVAVHVEKHSGPDHIALADRTIWVRTGAKNESFTARIRPIRQHERDVEHNIQIEQNVDANIVHNNQQQFDSNLEPPSPQDEKRPSDALKAARIGVRSLIRREASESEVALNADGYAHVIATLLANADEGERMSIAIFGHWGRGKTFLAKKVAERLRSEKKGDPRYDTVLFSAWKYRTPPEVWAYLFERLLEEGKRKNLLLPIRAALVRHGPWPLIVAMFGLFIALWTMSERAELLGSLIHWFGIGTLIYAAFLYIRFRSVAVRLRTLYEFASHSDKLGLQAAIGDDVRALLKAWCRKDLADVLGDCWRSRAVAKKVLAESLWPSLFYLAAALLITWKLWPLEKQSTWTIPLFGAVSMGMDPLVGRLLSVIWIICWVGGPALVLFTGKSTQRVLLVVDDLDRCEPKQMLEIIESTMLILDDHDVHKRLQLCMLIDESIFCHALIKKYSILLRANRLGPEHEYSEARIIRENFEKFFLVHLRLAALTNEEVTEVTKRYVQQLRGTREINSGSQEGINEGGEPNSLAAAPAKLGGNVDTDTVDVAPESHSVIEPGEADAILEFVKQHLSGETREVVGPRTLRCLLFRYQLAREILSTLGHHPDPRELANVIVAFYAHKITPTKLPSIVETVVRQVS